MTTETTATGALWFPHHFLGEAKSLGRDGVFFQQSHGDCSGAALKMILEHFGIPVEYGSLWQRLQNIQGGATMLGVKKVAENEGLLCEGWRLSPHDLLDIPLPAILLLHRRHFVVVAHVDAARGIELLDPVRGRLRVSVRQLTSLWKGETLLFCRRRTSPTKWDFWFREYSRKETADKRR